MILEAIDKLNVTKAPGPTWYRVGQKENILDLVLTNNVYVVESVDYCDHVSLLIYLNFESTYNSKLPKRMYYNGNCILRNELFNGFNWTLLLDALNTQECWVLFTDKVDYAIEKFILINDKNKSTSKETIDIYICCSDCVGVCGNVCCVAAIVKDSVF